MRLNDRFKNIIQSEINDKSYGLVIMHMDVKELMEFAR